MAISESLLNRRVSIARLVAEVLTAEGDLSSERSTLKRNRPIRICRNQQDAYTGHGEAGVIFSSTHKGFMLPSEGVRKGDFLTDKLSGEMYEVTFVDGRPGGRSDHHVEIYMDWVDIGGVS